jgi:hypothetical protein
MACMFRSRLYLELSWSNAVRFSSKFGEARLQVFQGPSLGFTSRDLASVYLEDIKGSALHVLSAHDDIKISFCHYGESSDISNAHTQLI